MKKIKKIPAQHQNKKPGSERKMTPKPLYDNADPGFGRLKDKLAVITGGDSGIGRAAAVAFAKEGADIVVIYLNEHEDAAETQQAVEKYGRACQLIATDIASEKNCQRAISKITKGGKNIDILVNNAGVQYPQKKLQDISAKQLQRTFSVNIFAQFYLTIAALNSMKPGSCIINTASVTAYKGNETLIDYSATKGAIVSFTRSLAKSLGPKGIRVNAVAPGPVWTPLIPSTFDRKRVSEFGKNEMMGRPAQPVEIAPCYVFLASKESNFMSGQTLHPNGGTIVNS